MVSEFLGLALGMRFLCEDSGAFAFLGYSDTTNSNELISQDRFNLHIPWPVVSTATIAEGEPTLRDLLHPTARQYCRYARAVCAIRQG